MTRIRTASFLCIFLIAASVALAEKPRSPEALAGVTIVNDNAVKANSGKLMIIDVRPKPEYAESHIPGAVSIPYNEKSELSLQYDAAKDLFDISKFPADKNAGMIIYCNGQRCWKCYKAADQLIKAGYKNIQWYRDGFPDWQAKGFPVE